MTGESIKE